MEPYTIEDFPGFVVQDSWSPLYLLAVVATEIHKKEFPNKVEEEEDSCDKNTVIKNKKLEKKKELVLGKENMITKRNFDRWGEGCSHWFEGGSSNGEQWPQKKKHTSSYVPIVQVNENTTPKRKFERWSDEGCSHWSEGCSSNDQEQSRQKKKRSSNVPQILSPELPEEFKNAIKELNGGTEFTGEMMLVIEKNLFKTDISKKHCRLSLPVNQIQRMDFLKQDEESFLRKRKPNGKFDCMEVKIIEPSLDRGVVDLRNWEMKNLCYVLTGKWNDVVTRNELEEGVIVQLWAFRIGEELCFALRKLSSTKTKKNRE